MSTRRAGIVLLTAMLLLPSAVSAFDGQDSTISRNWGKSFQAQKQAQIADPYAGSVSGPVEGLEGRSAQKVMGGYHESFSQEQVRQGYTLDNIGVMVGGN